MDTLDKLKNILIKAKEQLEKTGIPGVTSHDWTKLGPMKADHPDRQKVIDHISTLNRSQKPGDKGNALRHYENFIDGKPGRYTAGTTAKNEGCGPVNEALEMSKNGQWNLVKISETPNTVEGRDDKVTSSQSISEVPNKVTGAEDAVKAEGRCWEGYESTPGKKAYDKGSCQPIKKSEVPSNEIHLYKYEDETAEIIWGDNVQDETVETIIKSELQGWDEDSEEDELEKKEKPFHGYNSKKHSKEGGLNDKARKQYNKETGSNLKRPVTGDVKAGSKSAKRRKSFCARMSGVKGPTSKEGKLTPKGASLKRWKC